MGGKKKQKQVEWKDTSFPWCVERDYSLFVRNRCVFFHADGRRYKKTLNFALKFAAPNRIAVVCIYGRVQKLETLLKLIGGAPGEGKNGRGSGEKSGKESGAGGSGGSSGGFGDGFGGKESGKSGFGGSGSCCGGTGSGFGGDTVESFGGKGGPVVVFQFDTAAEDIDAYDARTAELKRMKSYGGTVEKIRGEIDRTEKAIRDGYVRREDHAEYIAERVRTLDTLRAGDEAEARIRDAQGKCVAFVNFRQTNEPEPVADPGAFLFDAAKAIWPCGVEANAPDETGAKQILTKRLIDDILTTGGRDLVPKVCGDLLQEQISFFSAENAGAVRMVDDIRAMVRERLAADGACGINGILGELVRPPYGVLTCNYYNAVIAFALAPFLRGNDRRIVVGLTTEEARGISPEAWLKRPGGILFDVKSEQKRCRKALEYIFDLPETESLDRTLNKVRSWCGEHVNTPLDCIDHRWYELLTMTPEDTAYYKKIAPYADWLETDTDAKREEVRTVDELYYGKYDRKKLDLFYKFYHVPGGAVGWLHEKDDFEERMRSYMEGTVCRECGRRIESIGRKDGTVYEEFNFHPEIKDNMKVNTEIVRFTKKDVIGLNKKLLGRYQTEYYCIPCLCEILDTDAFALYEKIQAFKLQGCELFG